MFMFDPSVVPGFMIDLNEHLNQSIPQIRSSEYSLEFINLTGKIKILDDGSVVDFLTTCTITCKSQYGLNTPYKYCDLYCDQFKLEISDLYEDCKFGVDRMFTTFRPKLKFQDICTNTYDILDWNKFRYVSYNQYPSELEPSYKLKDINSQVISIGAFSGCINKLS